MRKLMKRFIENLYRHTLKHLFQFIWKIKTLRTAAARRLSSLLAVALIFSVLPPPSFALTEADFEVLWLEGGYGDSMLEFHEGLALVLKAGKWGYIDRKGKEATPFIYDAVEEFREGLALVKKDRKYGYIDRTGKEIIPIIYYYAYSFSEGLAKVSKDWKVGYIDRTGKEIAPLIYDSAEGFHEGLARVKRDGKYGYIDRTGKEVIPLIYDSAENFQEGQARVKKDRKWGYVDKNGQFFFKTDPKRKEWKTWLCRFIRRGSHPVYL